MQVEAAKLELQGVKLQNEAEDNMVENDGANIGVTTTFFVFAL